MYFLLNCTAFFRDTVQNQTVLYFITENQAINYFLLKTKKRLENLISNLIYHCYFTVILIYESH